MSGYLCDRCSRHPDDCPCFSRLPEVERRRAHARVSRQHRNAVRRAAGLPEVERKWAA